MCECVCAAAAAAAATAHAQHILLNIITIINNGNNKYKDSFDVFAEVDERNQHENDELDYLKVFATDMPAYRCKYNSHYRLHIRTHDRPTDFFYYFDVSFERLSWCGFSLHSAFLLCVYPSSFKLRKKVTRIFGVFNSCSCVCSIA